MSINTDRQRHESRYQGMTYFELACEARSQGIPNDDIPMVGTPENRNALIARLRVSDTPVEHDCAKYGHPPHKPGMCPEGERFTCVCGQSEVELASDTPPLPEAMPPLPFVCRNCGVQQHAGGVCANCGRPFAEEPEAEAQPVPPERKPTAAEVLGLLTVHLLQEHWQEAKEIANEIRINFTGKFRKPIAIDFTHDSEVAELREALQKISDYGDTWPDCAQIARAALKGEGK